MMAAEVEKLDRSSLRLEWLVEGNQLRGPELAVRVRCESLVRVTLIVRGEGDDTLIMKARSRSKLVEVG